MYEPLAAAPPPSKLFFRKWDESDVMEVRFPRGNVHVAQSKICNFLSAQGAASRPLPVPVGDPAVVVESGPVLYDEAAAEDEDEEDEEACVSAMDLLGTDGQSQLPVSTQNAVVSARFCLGESGEPQERRESSDQPSDCLLGFLDPFLSLTTHPKGHDSPPPDFNQEGWASCLSVSDCEKFTVPPRQRSNILIG